MIGEGGYSEVYKGHLEDGQLVAVKRLIRGTTEEMTADYLSELGILVHVNHPNIASVIGYGVEGGMHLVLPLSVNGSLSCLLKGSSLSHLSKKSILVLSIFIIQSVSKFSFGWNAVQGERRN